MSLQPGKSSLRVRARVGFLLLLPLALLFWPACASLTIRQGWRKGLGPVVPHDTFPGDCAQCHEGGSWHRVRSDFTFDHAAKTGVALVGAHAEAQCLLCHNDRGPVQRFAARGCAGCHDDPHRGKLGASCTDCHDERTWHPREAIARHDRTRFPLAGAHAAVACYRCHAGAQVGNFEGADPHCIGCHGNDLARARNPDHMAQGWVADCQRCHLPLDWRPAQFAHPAGFPLTQGHAGRRCDECHANNNFVALPTNCDSCHLDDYQRTSNPNHQTAGFPLACQNCHSTANWGGGSFQHSASFPLSGGHAGRRCADCHASGAYRGLPSNCDSCHLDNYQRTSNPNHQTSGFPLACQNCHSTSNWATASFQHIASFPLTGGHAGRQCASCHASGVYRGLPSNCDACHLANYQRTTNPNHQAAGFPLTCQACHGTTSWSGATFNHRFPITSGAHANRTCSECHLDPRNYQSFSCTHCHEHDQTRMADHHRGVSGYVWSSPACLQCHPNGRH